METRWWASLRPRGLFISPSRIAELFPAELPPLPFFTEEKLRREWSRSRTDKGEHELIDVVLEWVCGLNNAYGRKWLRGSDVDTSWSRRALTGEVIRPRRIWLAERGAVLPVFVDSEARLGVGRGRRSVARAVEWLRATGHKVALLTNGRQVMLVYAGPDYEAWVEWDAALWFEDGTPGPQVDAFRALLSVESLVPARDGETSLLLHAIELSRKGQAELSDVLGERVRKAVELLVQAHGKALDSQLTNVPSRDIYRAAARIVMRLVVALFAEARDLLPRDNPVYHQSYGLNGLREQLGPYGTGERLRHRFGAYSRVLALFRLIYEGSHHEALPVLRYGGGLFTPGDAASTDPVSVALAAFERGRHDVSDEVVASILDLLCSARVKVRQGRTTTWVAAPVNFSDLSSEYIGILYEGLLDYELKRCADDDPTVFLALGAQPALPLSRLEAMDDRALKNLVEALKKGDDGEEDDADAEQDSEAPPEGEEAPDATDAPDEEPATEDGDSPRAAALRRARAWARRAALAGGLVTRRGRRRDTDEDPELEATAKKLVRDVILPGQWFLVRWGGTRKGHGTFYTRPQLTVPVVQRTLRPLAFDAPLDAAGKPDESAPPTAWAPKRPGDILALKVCDPSMGSGSFLVAALRFLTDALFASLHHHGCITPQGDGTLVVLPFGDSAAGKLNDILLPARPDADDFELRLRARLKRFVLERCLSGVDLDALAVELARLSLWVETMDRDMPFEFLRHKFKNGNSLIGCWFDRYRDYPVLAWYREGGDKTHDGVHHGKGEWTSAIAEMKGRVRESLVDVLTRQLSLLQPATDGAESLHDAAAAELEALHGTPLADPEEQETRYRNAVEEQPEFVALREAFDTWCALWLWPADRLELCPLPHDLPSPSEASRAVVRDLRAQYGFFHWELEFPDVFARAGGGFDAIVGNPPWEIQKPSSLEFFSNLDPLYRSYTKTAALSRQKELFTQSEADELAWVAYNASFKARSNWVKNVGHPWGHGAEDTERFSLGRGQAAAALHERWASARLTRRGYADARHPCRYQGSGDINTYKLFLEQSHALLRQGGALGMLVPSGIYSDLGARDLRGLFLERCRWEWLYAFQNERFVFEGVHHSFKVAIIGLTKGGTTAAVLTRFRLGPGGSPEASELEEDIGRARGYARYDAARVSRLSPGLRALFEIRDERDGQILDKIAAGITFVDHCNDWGLSFSRELDKTNDAKSLKDREHVRRLGVVDDADDVRDPGVRSRLRERGWTPVWQGANCRFDEWHTQPDLFARLDDVRQWLGGVFPIGVRRIARSTDARTLVACIVPPLTPTTYTIEVCRGLSLEGALFTYALISSLVLDYVMRFQVSSSVALSLLEGLPLPAEPRLDLVARATRRIFVRTPQRRFAARAALEAIVATIYGLSPDDLLWVLRDCDWSSADLADKPFTRKLNPTGFWRVDKELDPELRLPVMAQIAFLHLQEAIRSAGGNVPKGVESFLSSNDSRGWQLPETVRLSDYSLGHDERAKEPQPVASRFVPRVLPWQLEQSVEESWAECEHHARALLGDDEFERMTLGASKGAPAAPVSRSSSADGAGASSRQVALFATDAFHLTGKPPQRSKKHKR
jgi:hypothetical protein